MKTHTEKYRSYITMIYNKHKNIKDTTIFIRYAIKLEIDFEVEQHKREGLVFDWKCSIQYNIQHINTNHVTKSQQAKPTVPYYK